MANPASASVGTCTRCGETKPADQFYVRRSGASVGRLTSWCKACIAEDYRRAREKRKARVNSQQPLFNLKFCRVCGRELSLDQFSPDYSRADGRRATCRQCSNEAFKAARKNDYYVLRHYGLTIAEYDALLAAQGGVCAICGKPETKRYERTGGGYRLAVDHDHETGKVRALLCHACNAGIGHFNNDPELMAVAIHYLLRHSAES